MALHVTAVMYVPFMLAGLVAHFKNRLRKRNRHTEQLYLYTLAPRCPISQMRCTGGAGLPGAQIPPDSETHRLCSTGSLPGSGDIPRLRWQALSKRHTRPLGI